MLLDNEAARAIAEQQALLGLDMAFAANAAHSECARGFEERQVTLSQAGDIGEEAYNAAFQETRPKVGAMNFRYNDVLAAAGALVGRETLGGEYLSVQNGNEPRIYPDGSYSPNQR